MLLYKRVEDLFYNVIFVAENVWYWNVCFTNFEFSRKPKRVIKMLNIFECFFFLIHQCGIIMTEIICYVLLLFLTQQHYLQWNTQCLNNKREQLHLLFFLQNSLSSFPDTFCIFCNSGSSIIPLWCASKFFSFLECLNCLFYNLKCGVLWFLEWTDLSSVSTHSCQAQLLHEHVWHNDAFQPNWTTLFL